MIIMTSQHNKPNGHKALVNTYRIVTNSLRCTKPSTGVLLPYNGLSQPRSQTMRSNSSVDHFFFTGCTGGGSHGSCVEPRDADPFATGFRGTETPPETRAVTRPRGASQLGDLAPHSPNTSLSRRGGTLWDRGDELVGQQRCNDSELTDVSRLRGGAVGRHHRDFDHGM